MQHRILCALRAMFIIAAVAGMSAHAGGATPVGLWKTIDDETGMAKSLVRITDAGGELRGVVEKVFSPPASKPDPICDKCDGSRKDQPVVGMTIMWGLKQSGEREWSGGRILDPAKGKTYRCKVTVIDDGARLQMRGYVAFFYRTQTWLRAE